MTVLDHLTHVRSLCAVGGLACLLAAACASRVDDDAEAIGSASTKACTLAVNCPAESLVVMPNVPRRDAAQTPVDRRYAIEFDNGARALGRVRATETTGAMRIQEGVEAVLASPVHYNETRAPWVSRVLVIEILDPDNEDVLRGVILSDEQVKSLDFDPNGDAEHAGGKRYPRWGLVAPRAKENQRISLSSIVPKGTDAFKLRLTVVGHTVSGYTMFRPATESQEIRIVFPGLHKQYTFDQDGNGIPFDRVSPKSASLAVPRRIPIDVPLAGTYAITVSTRRAAHPRDFAVPHEVSLRVGDRCVGIASGSNDDKLRFVTTLPAGSSELELVHRNPIWDVPNNHELGASASFIDIVRTSDPASPPAQDETCAPSPQFTDPFDRGACDGKTLSFRDQLARHSPPRKPDELYAYPGTVGSFHVAHRVRHCVAPADESTCEPWTRLYDFPNGHVSGRDSVGAIILREDYLETDPDYGPNLYAPLTMQLTTGDHLKVLCTDGNKDRYAPGHWQSGPVIGPWSPFCAAWHNVDVNPPADASPLRFHRGDLYGNTRWGLSSLRYEAMTESCMRVSLHRSMPDGTNASGERWSLRHEAVVLGRFDRP